MRWDISNTELWTATCVKSSSLKAAGRVVAHIYGCSQACLGHVATSLLHKELQQCTETVFFFFPVRPFSCNIHRSNRFTHHYLTCLVVITGACTMYQVMQIKGLFGHGSTRKHEGSCGASRGIIKGISPPCITPRPHRAGAPPAALCPLHRKKLKT